MTTNTPLLEVCALTRRPWFEEYDLELRAGEVVVLRGPTGSGKTLFLRAIADLDPNEGGEARLRSRPASAFTPPDWRRQVVYVHPDSPLLGGTVLANLEGVLRLEANSGRTAEVPLGLDGAAPAAQLSSGEAARLALARALALEPPVLLLDETTAHLDGERARAAEAAVLAHVALGNGCLWVTHDDALAGRLGARTVLLR